MAQTGIREVVCSLQFSVCSQTETRFAEDERGFHKIMLQVSTALTGFALVLIPPRTHRVVAQNRIVILRSHPPDGGSKVPETIASSVAPASRPAVGADVPDAPFRQARGRGRPRDSRSGDRRYKFLESEAKALLFSCAHKRKQVLRFAQDDKYSSLW